MAALLTKELRSPEEMTCRPYICFYISSDLHSIRGTIFAEYMLEHFPDIILHDDVLEGFVGKG